MTNLQENNTIKNSVVLLRILIGWHFLYEGILKVYNPDWTSLGYLTTAQGPFKGLFKLLTTDGMVSWIDGMNMAALMAVGLTFILGFQEKKGAIIGMGLLALYYLAHPPFPGLLQVNTEGNYWIVNKNLIELAACWVIYQIPTGYYFGLDRLFKRKTTTTKTATL